MRTPPQSFDSLVIKTQGRPKRPSFGDSFFEWVHRYLFHVIIVGAVVVYIATSMRPQIVFATEADRLRFIQSVGAAESARVIVLVTEWCPACKNLEGNLNAEGVPFVRVDIEKSTPGQALFKAAAEISGSNGIPKAIVDRVLVGHSIGTIQAALREPKVG